MNKRRLSSIWILLRCLGSCPICKADNPTPPRSRFYKSENGKYVFALLLNDSQLGEVKAQAEFDMQSIKDQPNSAQKRRMVGVIEANYRRELKLRGEYKTSGLFLGGNPNKLLWAYNGDMVFLWAGDIKVANDGVHVVLINGWISEDRVAICFVASGKTIRSYTVGDLVAPNEKVRETVHGNYWSSGPGLLNNRSGTFSVKRVLGDSITFDIKTGNKFRGRLPRK